MASDLPGEIGAVDPGIDQLFRTLTGPATPPELAGEGSTLAMFRANSLAATLAPVGRAASPAGSRRTWRSFGIPVRWSVRLAAAAAVVLCGSAAAAAYAAVLPAPVQHLAHTVLGFVGVPDTHAGSAPGGSGESGRNTGTGPGRSSHRRASASSSHATSSARPGAAPSASGSPSVAAGQPVLSAFAASTRIAAGSEAVIDGRLTRSGGGVAGVTVTLVERLTGQAQWHVAGTGQTTTDGNVAVSVPALTANAVFRLATRGAAPSGGVLVIVTPQITTSLVVSPGGVQDTLGVTVRYADPGNVVVLQAQAADGSWQYVRSRLLNASGQASFTLSGTRLSDRDVRVVLLATIRHGAAIGSAVTVPPPG